MSKVTKAGCILIDANNKKVGLIYREKQNDYSFPKGHLEPDETILECAMRETAEETLRLPEILSQLSSQTYVDSKGDETTTHWYLARDLGKAHQNVPEELQHDLVWVDPEEVESKLSYDNLKELWNESKEKALKYMESLAP